MIDDDAVFGALNAWAREKIPGFEVRFKDESRWQRALAAVVFPVWPDYLTGSATTWGAVVYLPSRAGLLRNTGGAWRTLAHELVHAWDFREHPVGFLLGYAFPQALALLAPLGLLWWPAWLLLLALLPLPSPWRTRSERRGYAMGLAVLWWTGEQPAYGALEATARLLSSYYYTRRPPMADALRQLSSDLEAVRRGLWPPGPGGEVYGQIRAVLEKAGAVAPGR